MVLCLTAGGCRNSSPAGKRRVPGVELVSAKRPELHILPDDENGDKFELKDDSTNFAVTAATTLAVAICVASIALFVTIFVALQVHLRGCAKVTKRNSTMWRTQKVIFHLVLGYIYSKISYFLFFLFSLKDHRSTVCLIYTLFTWARLSSVCFRLTLYYKFYQFCSKIS